MTLDAADEEDEPLLLHISCHGSSHLTNASELLLTAGEPLSPDYLTNAIHGASLVVLSACATSMADGTHPCPEATGLSKALLDAGARSVLTDQGDVLDLLVRADTVDIARASWRKDQRHGLAGVFSEALLASLDHWSELADPTLMPAGAASRQGFNESTRRSAAAAAERVTHAAHEVRRSLVNDEPRISYAMTDGFVRDVLGFRRVTADLIDAAQAALLHAKLDDLPNSDVDAVRQLRQATARQRRCLRPLTETQLRGALVASLDQPVNVGAGGREMTLRDLVSSRPPLDSGAHADFVPLVRRVLDWLKPAERQVALAYAGFAVDWPDAAQMCGKPRKFGVRVQRKFRRVGLELNERITAARHMADVTQGRVSN
ncbi:hypothetical protein GCM10020358_74960 [Amorphoplanes nipponensis]|uniref:CHAT domain-containing protein n=1 Tax=Actinoplanes nipponensis TaxID=135950 RepID=A0A919JMR2_9ACTN|nr:CHAT domain-containing protein [Actinoplanes nipponensis]GIE52047.1 hypothetical protein Ani05nite_55810 [Actinoplanes nipponensis]